MNTKAQATETTTEEATLAESDWQRMDTYQRTEHLAPLVGKKVRYALLKTVREGHETFGPDYPTPWRDATPKELVIVYHKPGVRFSVPSPSQSGFALMPILSGGTTFERHAFDDLYDIQPVVIDAAPPATLPEPDFDGADVYAADEVNCPHCGAKLRVTQRATVEKATADEEEE